MQIFSQRTAGKKMLAVVLKVDSGSTCHGETTIVFWGRGKFSRRGLKRTKTQTRSPARPFLADCGGVSEEIRAALSLLNATFKSYRHGKAFFSAHQQIKFMINSRRFLEELRQSGALICVCMSPHNPSQTYTILSKSTSDSV